MPSVTLTESEYRRDLLPPVCARCGAPATDRVPRIMRIPPEHLIWLWAVPVLITLVLCPPLFLLLAVLVAERIEVRVPMCPDHRDDWTWRDRATNWLLFPLWSLAAMGLAVGAVLDDAFLCPYIASAFLVLLAAAGVEFYVIGYGAVMLVGAEGMDVRLRRVHPAFVDALDEARERDRRDNPFRFRGFGDERDDYDDQPQFRGPPRPLDDSRDDEDNDRTYRPRE